MQSTPRMWIQTYLRNPIMFAVRHRVEGDALSKAKVTLRWQLISHPESQFCLPNWQLAGHRASWGWLMTTTTAGFGGCQQISTWRVLWERPQAPGDITTALTAPRERSSRCFVLTAGNSVKDINHSCHGIKKEKCKPMWDLSLIL